LRPLENVKMDKIKVFLSDPQVLFREGIHFVLSGEEDFEVTGETTNNEDAFTHIESNSPNIAILSMNDVKTAGPEITRRIRRNNPSVSVILTVDKKEPERIFEAIKSGASACINKDTEPDHLLAIIKVVAQGSVPLMEELLTPAIAAMAVTEFTDLAEINQQLGNLLAGLAPKEQQILAAIASGSNIEQITAKLDASEEIIRRNIRLVFNKLVANEQTRSVIDAAQRNMSSFVRPGKSRSNDYVTRTEFNEFKEQLMERFKSLIGHLS
jgi:two-component system, NarL family, response regulator DevR